LWHKYGRNHTICRPNSDVFVANVLAYLKYLPSYRISFCIYFQVFVLWQLGLE